MAKISDRSRIYGLTIKQWTTLAIVVAALVVFGCQFCYRTINRTTTPENSNGVETANGNRGKKRQPREAKPNGNLSTAEATARYLKFGNPSNAASSDANNFLMVNSSYALSYNRLKATANWVAWTVTAADFGAVDRANDFRPDANLPNGFYRATPTDYTGSGFDRGHLCPSADRTASPELNSQTFLMTNIVPQTPDLNQGVWKRFEDYTRDLVEQGSDVYVVAGVYGSVGKLKNKITVPSNNWKVVVVLPESVDDANNLNGDARVVAVDVPNTNGVRNDDWRKYRTTVRDIEQKTNLNLFSNLPPNVQNVLETKRDAN